MEHPANAIVVNGVVIGILEEHTAAALIALSENGKYRGLQSMELEQPIKRDDFKAVREVVGVDLAYHSTVRRHEVKLTLEFVKQSEPKLLRDLMA